MSNQKVHSTVEIIIIVYNLKFVRPLIYKLVTPMPEEQLAAPDLKRIMSVDSLGKNIIMVRFFSGTNATKFKF